jgi:hypothetical protein
MTENKTAEAVVATAAPAPVSTPIDSLKQAENLMAQVQAMMAADEGHVTAAETAANAANAYAGEAAGSAEISAKHAGLAENSSSIAGQHATAAAAQAQVVADAAAVAATACETIGKAEHSVHTEFEAVAEMHSSIVETVATVKKVSKWGAITAGALAVVGGITAVGIKVVAPRVRARRHARRAAAAAPPFAPSEGAVTAS